jgi:hypothetical protein
MTTSNGDKPDDKTERKTMVKRIKQTTVNRVLVSTVQLLDPMYNGVYETVVLDGDWSDSAFERRASTLEQAMKNHADGIARVQKAGA